MEEEKGVDEDWPWRLTCSNKFLKDIKAHLGSIQLAWSACVAPRGRSSEVVIAIAYTARNTGERR